MKVGIDLVHIPKFAEKIKDGALLRRLFVDEELTHAGNAIETLAGMCAAKEAYFKAVRQTPDWHTVQVLHDTDGAPQLHAWESASVSVSHDGDYVIAVVAISDH